MGEVLADMSKQFSHSWDSDSAQEWFERTEAMSRELESAWQTVRFARESRRINPRTAMRISSSRVRPAAPESAPHDEKEGYESILLRVDEGISHLRNLARTLREASSSETEWNTQFREEWASIVADAGRAIADPDSEVEPVFDRLEQLSGRYLTGSDASRRPPGRFYGSLITSLRHIVVIVDDVASARRARESD